MKADKLFKIHRYTAALSNQRDYRASQVVLRLMAVVWRHFHSEVIMKPITFKAEFGDTVTIAISPEDRLELTLTNGTIEITSWFNVNQLDELITELSVIRNAGLIAYPDEKKH